MKIEDLPRGNAPKALVFPHFPTRIQAVVWRNWGMVTVQKLAEVLRGTEEQIIKLAEGMGLKLQENLCDIWKKRGYISIIRRNWHLLPYEQLLELLEWTPKEMAFALKEDDFLLRKLGNLKPEIDPVYYKELTQDEQKATEKLSKILSKHFSNESSISEQPFEFINKKYKTQKIEKSSDFGMKLAYSYSAVYGDPLLDEELDPYPENLLAQYASNGINAVWLQGTLYTLVPWLGESEYSKNWQKRLDNLRKLAQRTEKYGIRLYLYLNEPRNMMEDFFKKNPSWKGSEENWRFALCTSNKEVLEALKNGVATLFREVPELGGVFTITMSENLTHCRSRNSLSYECPVCAKRDPAEFPAEVNRAIAEGVHSVKPDADVIAWTWAWSPEWDERAVEKLPKDVKLMCVSETAVPTDAMGIKGEVLDYSISKVGPGPIALKLWKKAIENGLGTVAKVQLNNTWECSAVPYIPVPDLVECHLDNLKKAGVKDLMISWTLGGYPGGNLELTDKPKEQVAEEKFGIDAAPCILLAWKEFSSAFEHFPLHSTSQLYTAPQNYGPMNLLFAKPSGYSATMVGFPYDDLESWRGYHYPEDIFEEQFRKLSEGWGKGLETLKSAKSAIPEEKQDNYSDLGNVAEATYCHFRSSYLQIRFVRLRTTGNSVEIQRILDEEIELAKRLMEVVKCDSRIGFEASNHYYYTVNDLKEKVINCEYLKNIFT